ncbi:MAG TPA: TIGR03118 family protein [Isosphaeraceae bacterium]|nr:TIGR03118 family protein [Isosphaeraceae bacterium]
MASDLIGISTPISPVPVEGAAFTSVVAKFTDADGNTNPADYAASIDWGNGHVTKGSIVADPGGGFDVVGSYTYPRTGVFRITAHIGDTDGDSVSVSTSNVVTEAAITANAATIPATKSHSLLNVVVATFTDADHFLKASDFSATINWGDGQTSPGAIVYDGASGKFEVLGAHRYKTTGTFSVNTAIRQGQAAINTFYATANLISDGAVTADHVNPNLVNPWGLAAPNPGDFWNGNNGAGTSSLFDSSGNVNTGLPFVTIPPPAGSTATAAPTGVVFNGGGSFTISDGTKSGSSIFIFATEDGTISGWNPRVSTNGSTPSTQAFLAVDDSAAGAVFKGLTLLTVPAGSTLPAGRYLFATDFRNGVIDAFDQNFHPVALPAGTFHDAAIPAGFAPFGIQSVGGNLYVTYAKQNAAKHDDVAGPGNGFVDVYSPSGVLLQRLGGGGTQLELNSPWGVTQAPANFGQFSNAILVGNFGDSHINAFDPTTGRFLGQLTDASGTPLNLDGGVEGSDSKGLWSVFAFPAATGNPTNSIFFTSGINDESDGLFGSLTAVQVATASAGSSVVVTKRM